MKKMQKYSKILSLDMAQSLLSQTHSSCGYLHRIKPVKFQQGPGVLTIPLILARGKEREEVLCEFKDSLVYIVSSNAPDYRVTFLSKIQKISAWLDEDLTRPYPFFRSYQQFMTFRKGRASFLCGCGYWWVAHVQVMALQLCIQRQHSLNSMGYK